MKAAHLTFALVIMSYRIVLQNRWWLVSLVLIVLNTKLNECQVSERSSSNGISSRQEQNELSLQISRYKNDFVKQAYNLSSVFVADWRKATERVLDTSNVSSDCRSSIDKTLDSAQRLNTWAVESTCSFAVSRFLLYIFVAFYSFIPLFCESFISSAEKFII